MHLNLFIIECCLMTFLSFQSIDAQQIRQPFDFPILLSGNFGELRSTHFHTGIDFKTQGVQGQSIHAPEDGYISHITVSAFAYGYSLFMTHPNGLTTFYGHLNRFAPKIAQFVKEQQYKQERYDIDMSVLPNLLTFGKGDIIAYSGNSGSSAGPHLHFEVHDTPTDNFIDPIEYFKSEVEDTRAPRITGVMVCPMNGRGAVNGGNKKIILRVTTAANGRTTLVGTIEAWGEIGMAVRAIDLMNKTDNTYGVKDITLRLDNHVIYHSHINRFALREAHYLASFVDFAELRTHGQYYMRSFVEPGNMMPGIESRNRGIININEQKTYNLTYTLSDAFGNTTSLNIHIKGKPQPIIQPVNKGTLLHWNTDNRVEQGDCQLFISKGNLYDDFYFQYAEKTSGDAIAPVYMLHNNLVPIHKSASLSIKVPRDKDSTANIRQYGIVHIVGKRCLWIPSTCNNNRVEADIKEFGNYSVRRDTKQPTIAPLYVNAWTSRKEISFRLTDDLSGIQSYRGEIDGHYALFEINRQAVISYAFDKERLQRGQHIVKITATDFAGNTATFIRPFFW